MGAPLLTALLAATLLSAGQAAPRSPRPGGGDDPGAAWGVASPLEKLRPGDPLPGGRSIALAAARGGCGSAQVAVRASSGLAALSAEAPELRGPGRLAVTLYRVATVTLALPSGPDGSSGEWPDPLIPVRDPFFGEARRAFPVAVGAGRLQAVWVEVCVPADARPGAYTGHVTLAENGQRLAEVPVSLQVWPFALPRTPTFSAPFGLSTRLGTRALGAPDDPEVARALVAAALRHRLSPFTLSADPPSGRCTAQRCDLDWSALDAELGPVLDGTLVPGVKGTFAEVRIAGSVWSGPEEDLAATLRAWHAHFQSRGWADRLWLYTLDEPRPDQLPELSRRARLAHAAGIKVLATTLPQPELAGLVDAYAPVLNALSEDGRPAAGVALLYASCMSHGCAELPAEDGSRRRAMLKAFTGWPGYEIDRPGTAARAVAWLAWRQGLSGMLYYDMLQAWKGDPWTDPRRFAGNGDGTLLYPGRPEQLGGRRPFPVESIRLKIIRESLEDVELLRMAGRAGLDGLVDSRAGALVPSARRWERATEPWREARLRIGEALARRAAGPRG